MKIKLAISKGKIISLIVILIFVAFLVYNKIHPSSNNNIISYSYPSKYIQVLNDSIQNNLRILMTNSSDNRNPIVQYLYNGKYNVQIFKIADNVKAPLNDLIVNRNSPMNEYGSFFSTAPGNYSLSFRFGIPTVPHIYVYTNGTEVKTEINSSNCLYIYSKAINNFSVGYNPEGDAYIIGKKGHLPTEPTSNADSSCELMFLKRNDSVYFLFISPEKEGVIVKPSMLLGMIKQ